MNKQKVIIIGGGTSGITIANRLQEKFDVSVIDKSQYKKYPLIYKVPLMIGVLFRKPNCKYINKLELELESGRKVPFYQSNLLGGASVMNGAVHVFGFKSKWQQFLKRFQFSFDDLQQSNRDIYSSDKCEKNKITVLESPSNVIDISFFETLKLKGIPLDDMSHSEKESCGPVYNTVRTFFRTSVLSLLKRKKFQVSLNEKVEEILFDETGKILGVKTSRSTRTADFVILCAGVVGSCELLLRQKKSGRTSFLSNLPVGERIQDHTNIRVNVVANKPLNSLNEVYDSFFKKIYLGLRHFLGQKTVMRGTGATSAAYLDLDKDGVIDTRIHILQFAEVGRHGSSGSVFASSEPCFSISINAIHPESRGSIQIDQDRVKMNPNFLSASKDIEILKASLKYCVELLKSNPIYSHVLRIDRIEEIESDPEAYIRETVYSGHHFIGGLQDVVDSDFSVKNTKGFYICDASVFNEFVASNIHSSVVLLSDLFAKRFVKLNA